MLYYFCFNTLAVSVQGYRAHTSNIIKLPQFVNKFKNSDIHKLCVKVSEECQVLF